MAINTAELRRSAGGTSFGYVGILPGVTPNATKDQEWRQQAGWGYSGILAAVPTIADPTDGVTFTCLNRFVTYKGDRIAEMTAIDRFNDYD